MSLQWHSWHSRLAAKLKKQNKTDTGTVLFFELAVYRGNICVLVASVFVCGMGVLTGKGLTPAWAPTCLLDHARRQRGRGAARP